MLSTALTPLKQDVFRAIKSKDTQEALAKALLSTFPAEAQNDKRSKEIASDFGEIAAGYLAGALTKPLCEAIDKYVKQIGIMITPTTLVAPNGPVTGVIKPTDVRIL